MTRRNHARPRGGMRGLGAYNYPNGPYGTGQNLANRMAQQAIVDQNPTDYSSPQSAIAAGLDPTAVRAAWLKGLAQYPTQQAAVDAGIMPAVVTQLWSASRQYAGIAASRPRPNYAPLVMIGTGVILLIMLEVGDKGGAE